MNKERKRIVERFKKKGYIYKSDDASTLLSIPDPKSLYVTSSIEVKENEVTVYIREHEGNNFRSMTFSIKDLEDLIELSRVIRIEKG